MSKSLQFDFSLLPHWVQSRLLILDFNVLDANWTRSIYLRQRQQLIQTYLEEVSSTSSSHSSFFSPTTVDKYNKNELNESNEVHDIKTLNTQNGSWKHSTHASFSLEDRNETSSELDSSFVVLPDSSSEITIKLKKKNPVLEPSLNPSSTPLLTSHSPMLSTSSSTFDGLKNTPKTELTLFTTPSLNAPHHSNKNTSPSSYSELPTNSQIHTRPLNSKPSTTPTENAEPVSCMPATSKINRSENIIMSSDFIDEEVSSLPKDYLWSRLCKLVTSRPSSPYIKVLNSHGSLVQTISVNTFIEHVKRIAWYLLTEQKKNMQPDQPPSTESTSQLPFTFHTFLIVSSNATVHLECMVAGWLAGIPCAPMYLYQVKTKLDATRVLETLQPRWVVLDSSSSHMTSSFQNWIPKKFNLRVYQELLSSLENEKHINLDTPRIEDPPPIFYIDTHWHPSRHSHLRTIAVSVDTVHRHCRWLKPYMGSVFLQPYKLSGASHLVSLASLCHGSTLIIINDRISHFSIDQWFVLLHTYHVQSTWLRSITSRQWHSASSSSSSSTSTSSGSSSSITSSHPTPTEHLLLEDPTSPQIHFLKPYAENVVGFTCCDTLSGIWIGLGEVIPNVSTTNPSWLTAYPSLVWIPSLIRLPLGDTKPSVQSPLLYLPNPHASHGYYLIHHRENDVLYLMNLGSSEDLWHSVPETRRFPLLYCSWFYQMFPGLSHFSFFLVSRLPWLVYSGSIHSSLLETFLATLDMSAVVLQVRRLDKLDLLWTLVEVKMFRWCSNGKKTIPPCLPTPSFTQASVSKPLTTSLIYSCLFEYLIHHAENMPDQVAYMDSTQEITWSVLSQRVSLAAMYLFKKGLSPGDTVIISYIHSIDYIIVLHACLYSGILVIPLAPPDLARLTEEVPRWISVILEFGIQTILAGNGVIELLQAKPFRSAVKRYSKYCSFPSIHHLSSTYLNNQNPSATQTLGKDGLQLPSHFFLNSAVAALVHVTFDKDQPKPVCTYTHPQLIYLIHMISETLTSIHPELEETSVVSCIRTYAGLGLMHALGYGPYLGKPTLLLSTMDLSRSTASWLERIYRYPLLVTKPLIQHALHLDIDLLDRLKYPLLLHESVMPITSNVISCLWEISGAPLAAGGVSRCLYLDTKQLCQAGVIHYTSKPQAWMVPIMSAGTVVRGGELEVRPWDNHAPIGNGFGKFMFRYHSSSLFRGSLDSYHYGFITNDHIFPLCQSVVPNGQGVVPLELMESIMEQHVVMAFFLQTSTAVMTLVPGQWVGIIELTSSMCDPYDPLTSLETPTDSSSQASRKGVLMHGALAVAQGHHDVQQFFGIHIHRILVVYPSSLPRTRLNEKQRSGVQQLFYENKLNVIKEFAFD